eukprot:COSAG02_NODE_55998_length_287_cov_1.382979_1_plen_55_part_10
MYSQSPHDAMQWGRPPASAPAADPTAALLADLKAASDEAMAAVRSRAHVPTDLQG